MRGNRCDATVMPAIHPQRACLCFLSSVLIRQIIAGQLNPLAIRRENNLGRCNTGACFHRHDTICATRSERRI